MGSQGSVSKTVGRIHKLGADSTDHFGIQLLAGAARTDRVCRFMSECVRNTTVRLYAATGARLCSEPLGI